MARPIPPPNPQELLPPLLACLPTAAFSGSPPPALSQLLTPILNQRVHVLASTGSPDSWLTVLNWNRDQAMKLPEVVGRMTLEPHPVSGEIEILDLEPTEYRRLDSETLHARICVEEFGLMATYLWCMAEAGKGGSSWRLTELSALEDKRDALPWFTNMEAADAEFKSRECSRVNGNQALEDGEEDEEDDSAYWAAYDMTPGRTPAKCSPAPNSRLNGHSVQQPSKSEMEYFERYMNEVQPAMDPYDASEDANGQADSSLDHHRREFVQPEEPPLNGHRNGTSNGTRDPVELVISVPDTPHHPQPSPSSSPRSIRALEEQADTQSHMEVGIKQHISTDIKALYRLARSAGISLEEFERIVKTELEVLPLMDMA